MGSFNICPCREVNHSSELRLDREILTEDRENPCTITDVKAIDNRPIELIKEIGKDKSIIILYLESGKENTEKYTSLKEKLTTKNIFLIDKKESLNQLLNKSNEKGLRIYLLTSYKLGKELYEENFFSVNENFESLFIYSSDTENPEEWTNSYSKIKLISNDFQSISEKLIETIYEYFIQIVLTSEFKMNLYCNHEENVNAVLFSKLSLSLINNVEVDEAELIHNQQMLDQAEEDFIDYCEQNYSNYLKKPFNEEENNYNMLKSEIQQKLFIGDQAVLWFLRQTFFNNLFNEVLRKNDICDNFEMRYSIFHLNEGFKKFNVEKSLRPNYLYKASTISQEEFRFFSDSSSEEKYVQMRGFSNINRVKSETLKFAKVNKLRIQQDPNYQEHMSILFQINTENSQDQQIFDLTAFSDYWTEDELTLYGLIFLKLVKIVPNDNIEEKDYFDYIIELEFAETSNFISSKTNMNLKGFQLHLVNFIEDIKQKNYNISYFYLSDVLSILKDDQKLTDFLEKKYKKYSHKFNKNDELYHLDKMASINLNKGTFETAIDTFQKTLLLRKESLPSNHPELAASLQNYANALAYKGDFEEAVKYQNEALLIKKATLPSNHPDIANSLNDIATVLTNNGKFDEAINYLNEGLEIQKSSLPANHPDIGNSLTNIGNVLLNNGNLQDAFNYLNEGLDILKNSLPANHPDIANSSNTIGSVLINSGNYDEAYKYINEGLEIRKASLPSDHPDIARSYNNIANVHVNKGEYDEAINYYKLALDIYKVSLPSNHPHIAVSYNNIGNVYYSKGEYDEALNYQTQALDIRLNSLTENHSDIARSYMSIGNVYSSKENYDEAILNLEKALEIFKISLNSNHPDLASCYSSIGSVYSNKGDFYLAIENYNFALEIYKSTLSSNHPDIASSYNNLANVSYNKGEYDEAINYYNLALEIYKTTLSPNHPDIVNTLNSIGNAYSTKKEYDSALNYFNEALEIRKVSLPANHLDLASSNNSVGNIYLNKGDFDSAIKYLEETLNIRKESLPPNHPDIGKTCNSIGIVYSKKRDFNSAVNYFNQALEILKETLPADHHQIMAIQKNVDILNKTIVNHY